MIAIPVSGTVFVILMVLGALAYMHDGAKKVRNRNARKAAQARLNADLQAPKPPPQLPYGFAQDSDTGPDAQ